MAVKVLMPKLGLTMTEGKIIRWLKQEGEAIQKGEPLLEIETEKIVTEVESPGSGILVKIFHFVDDVVPITTVVGLLAEKGEDWSAAAAEFQMPLAASGGPASSSATPAAVAVVAAPPDAVMPDSGARLKISPLARRIAAEHGLTPAELRQISGSGPGGRIVKNDLLLYRERTAAPPAPVAAAAAPVSDRLDPLSNLRAAIARRMTQSFTTTPHFYLEAEVDATALIKLRRDINTALQKENSSVSLNDILVKITAAVLEKHPYLNSSYSDKGIVFHGQINIGVAVALEEGLIVPVIKDASRKGLLEIARTGKELIAKARAGRLALDDITGGTFTLSNLGMYAVDAFTAIINPPESAILAVGRVVEKPLCENGQMVARPQMRITLGLDHRAIDGARGARFLGELVEYIEKPYLLAL